MTGSNNKKFDKNKYKHNKHKKYKKYMNKRSQTGHDKYPNISINELGVPEDIAKNLTYPDIVTPYNIDQLKKIVKNGYNKYPGAKSIKRKSDGKIISLKVISSQDYEIEIGDIIKEVNRDKINDISSFKEQLTKLKNSGRSTLLLSILRDKKLIFISVKLVNN